jgi:hypothetical protein
MNLAKWATKYTTLNELQTTLPTNLSVIARRQHPIFTLFATKETS